ncbi:hypothetical protein C8A01DRAFT_34490, partial [Parachaetomium inaequale]
MNTAIVVLSISTLVLAGSRALLADVLSSTPPSTAIGIPADKAVAKVIDEIVNPVLDTSGADTPPFSRQSPPHRHQQCRRQRARPLAAATNPNAQWTEGVEDIQWRIVGVLPSLLRGLGLVCPKCKAEGERIAKGNHSATAKSASGAALPCARTCLGFLAQGCWNRAFLVVPCGGTLDDPRFRELVFRVALPAMTHMSKVAAEVATMEWVRRDTAIPVPDVLAYASGRDNDVGYE